METIDTILNRHSTRNFIKGEVVPDSDIETILKCACQAPSAMNKQPWDFIVVKDQKTLEILQNAHPYAGFLMDAGCAIVVVADPANSWQDYWKVDPLLAGENILLAAQNLGLGACWCGVYPDSLKMQNIANALQIPEPYQAMALIAIGYSVQPKQNVQPRYTSAKIHQNHW